MVFILQLPSVTGWHLVPLNWAERKSSGRVAQVHLLKDTGGYWDGERPEIMDRTQPGSAIKPNGKPQPQQFGLESRFAINLCVLICSDCYKKISLTG